MCQLKLLLLLIATVNAQFAQNTAKISVYYEALCPDSVRFIEDQLYPTYQKIGDYLDIDLIPFGFASSEYINNTYHFKCQHGPRECYSNMVQSCTFFQNLNPDQIIQYVNCVESSNDPSATMVLKKCAMLVHVEWNTIQQCLEDGSGAQLLLKYQERTNSVVPPIKFIPTIIFNDVFDQTLQDGAITNLLRTVCTILESIPEKCPKYFDLIQYNT